jgi:hypothetical protein
VSISIPVIELDTAARFGHLFVRVRGAPELYARDDLTDDKHEQNPYDLMHQMNAGSLERYT